ncbi:gluconate:H+ symporter [Oceanobacillus jeddahense]|uniref:Gluconate:H+ symporter n=1 Tax=Oceanobacillus jeddahense TaxID=1462527 RepID=A0ABY5JTV1_9BACI|nr:gluconate:H+ symporter [Oceanobacillus jeddahense]UUI03763.1 gluconate:H+ symporter [Oceanobacillus jeddahense]
MENIYPLIIVALAVVALLLLIMKWNLNTFISLIVVAFLTALALGMSLGEIVETVQTGLGGTLGDIALIFVFGAMLGKLVADAGGAQRISLTLINAFGKKRIQWAVVIASFIIGVALFFEVGLVLLIPIVYQIAKEIKLPLLYLGLPMTAALSVTHGFLPPHPGPTVIAQQYDANIGMVLLIGMVIAVPTVIIAGPLFTKVAQKLVPDAFSKIGNIGSLGTTKQFKEEEMPGFGVSALTALSPVILMAVTTIVQLFQDIGNVADHLFFEIMRTIGDPTIALLLSLLFAIYTMGIARKIPMKTLMSSAEESVRGISIILMVTAGGGALKQVLIDGGVGDAVANIFSGTNLSPIFLAWVIAAILRIALGSATVAALTTAGMVIPLIEGSDVNLALMVLATGAGSLIASHVNDTGFWIFKEYFNLSMKETFATWTLLETIISVSGLIFTLLLSLVI